MPIERKIVDTIEWCEDSEIHTSVLTIDGKEFIDFRQYIPSLSQYSRGVTFPVRLMPEAVNGLLALADHYDGKGESWQPEGERPHQESP